MIYLIHFEDRSGVLVSASSHLEAISKVDNIDKIVRIELLPFPFIS